MYRNRNNRKRWRLRWPWRVLFPLRVDERFCRECGLPYHEGPHPKEVNHFPKGNVDALVFPAGSWHQGKLVVRIGRWTPKAGKFFHSEYIPEEELDDLLAVVAQARDEYRARKAERRSRA
jgi:hypothetical protein